MSLTISDEKVNVQAVALEIARNEIILDMEKSLGLTQTPVSLGLLKKRVEEHVIETKFEDYKKVVIDHLSAEPEESAKVPDYRVELYLRTFVVESFLDNRYMAMLELLKEKMQNDLFLKFPIETIVLEESVPQLLGITFPEDASSFVRKPIKNFLGHLNLSGNFDTLVTMIVGQVRFLECILSEDPKASSKAKDLVMDNKITAKILEKNCCFIKDIAFEFYKAILANYHVSKLKDEEELQRLETDFAGFVKSKLTNDIRMLGKLSPKDVADAVAIESRKAWKLTKAMVTADIEARVLSSESLTRYERDRLAKLLKSTFSETLEKNFITIFGFFPRKDLFLQESNDCVAASVDRLLDLHFARVSSTTKELAEGLKFELSYLLSLMLKADTSFRFKYFPVLPQYNPDQLLPAALRKWFVVAAASGAPLAFDPTDAQRLSVSLHAMASALEVSQDAQVRQAIDSYEANSNRSQSLEASTKAYEEARKEILTLVQNTGPRDVAYILMGLYFITTDGERDLLELRRAVAKSDVATFRPPDYGRRLLVLRVASLIKDGRSPLLNYQVVLLVEGLLEKLRSTHNRFVSTKVLRKPLVGMYNLDYDEAVDSVKKLSVRELAKLVKGEEETSEISVKFISDTTFRPGSSTKTEEVMMIAVDSDLTVQNLAETPLLQRLGGHSPSRDRPNSEVEGLDQKLLGKLQHIKENVRKFQVVSLHADTNLRSRFPILCISGFISEDTDSATDWASLLELFPFTEVLTINWESFTAKNLASGLWDSLQHVSFRSLTDLMVDSLGQAIQEKETNENLKEKAHKFDRSPSIHSNPFQDNDLEGATKDKLEDHEIQEVTPKPKNSLWSLWRRHKLATIFSREMLLKVTFGY